MVRFDIAYYTDPYGRPFQGYGVQPHYRNRPGLDAMETVMALIEEGSYTAPIRPASNPNRERFVPLRGELMDFSEDAIAAVEHVESAHPNFIVEGRMCMERYEAFREAYLAATANPMTHTEFTLATQRFLTVFRDGHLSRTFFTGDWVWIDSEWEWETQLFQDGYFIDHLFLSRNGRLFLADEDYVITDIEVLAIGGVPVDNIFAVVDSYFGAYNDAGIQRARGRYSRYQLMLQLAGSSLYLDEGRLVTDITVLIDGAEHVIEMGFTPHHPSSYRLPSYQLEYRVRWEMMGNDVFYLSLHGGILNNEYFYEAAAAIEQAMADGVRKYIIDVRNFRGGVAIAGTTFFSAMGATPPGVGHIIRLNDVIREWIEENDGMPHFHYFDHLSWADFIGRDYVYIPRDPGQSSNPYGVFIVALTSDRSFSAATVFASEVADSGFGIVIGEPSATAPTGVGYGQTLWLDTARLELRPHYTFFLRPDAYANQDTLVPDILVYEWDALEVALGFFAD